MMHSVNSVAMTLSAVAVVSICGAGVNAAMDDESSDRGKVGDDGEVDFQANLHLARGLLTEGEHEEATEKFLWLWENMLEHDPDMATVRYSHFIGDLNHLLAVYQPAREPFAILRDSYEEAMTEGRATRDEMRDWLRLNPILDDLNRPIDWYEKFHDNDDMQDVIEKIRPHVFILLTANKRWDEAGQMLHDPVADAERLLIDLGREVVPPRADLDERALQRMRRAPYQRAISSISRRYPALLAAGRDEEAETIVNLLFESIDGPYPVIITLRNVIHANVARPHHLEWLDHINEDEVFQDLDVYRFEVLTRLGRWDEAGRMLNDPVADATRVIQQVKAAVQFPDNLVMDPAMRRRHRNMPREQAISSVSRQYAALYAVDRGEEAEEIAELLFNAIDSAEAIVAVLQRAIDADVVQRHHLDWLESVRNANADADAEDDVDVNIDDLEQRLIARIEPTP